MTVKDKLFSSEDTLALFLLRTDTVVIDTRDGSRNFDEYVTPDGEKYGCLRAAIDHTVEWLHKEYSGCECLCLETYLTRTV